MNRTVTVIIIVFLACTSVSYGQTSDTGPTSSPIIVYSAELNGKLESCRCAERTGGPARRETIIDDMRNAGSTLILLEGGDLTEASTQGDVAKFQMLLSALDYMGYVALGLGDYDLALGARFFDTIKSRNKIALLCSNVVTDDGRHPFASHIVVETSLDRKPVKIAIIGAIENLEGFRAQAEKGGFHIEDPIESVRHVLDDVKKSTDFQIVLYHADEDGAKTLKRACPDIDLVFLTEHKVGLPKSLSPKDQIPELVTGGRRGKFLALVGLRRDSHGEIKPHAFRVKPVSEDIPDSKPVRTLIESYYEGLTLDKVRFGNDAGVPSAK